MILSLNIPLAVQQVVQVNYWQWDQIKIQLQNLYSFIIVMKIETKSKQRFIRR